jgi:hypothetical protein
MFCHFILRNLTVCPFHLLNYAPKISRNPNVPLVVAGLIMFGCLRLKNGNASISFGKNRVGLRALVNVVAIHQKNLAFFGDLRYIISIHSALPFPPQHRHCLGLAIVQASLCRFDDAAALPKLDQAVGFMPQASLESCLCCREDIHLTDRLDDGICLIDNVDLITVVVNSAASLAHRGCS